MIELPIRRLREDAVLPERAYAGDAGLDLAACERHELGPGESVLLEPGAFLYKDSGVQMTVESQKLTTGLFGGTGLNLARMTGPGRVGIQSMYVHHATD